LRRPSRHNEYVGNAQALLTIRAALVGCHGMILADKLGRVVMSPLEFSTLIVAALIGHPY
jgi:ABC-type Fe3+-siderophore transport system permease subunit